jgi:hypothetical protein
MKEITLLHVFGVNQNIISSVSWIVKMATAVEADLDSNTDRAKNWSWNLQKVIVLEYSILCNWTYVKIV